MHYELKTSAGRVVYTALTARAVNRYCELKGYRWIPCDGQIMRGYFVNDNGDRLFIVPVGV